MKKKTNKKKLAKNKFGVFNGNIVNSETLGVDQEFAIENYKDSSLTISEIEKTSPLNKKDWENNIKSKKRKTNYLIYKIAAYIIILLIIVLLIVWLVIT
ncbi:hypothetical protein [Spiroplasma cantharicola]|uniref:hypothetical protein n=1 Tax=Spiroplasma cantharicola TaxID=362837 RepID=UPI0006B4C0E7|nr:hypothetical protein [Spiroplasma cantharicola]